MMFPSPFLRPPFYSYNRKYHYSPYKSPVVSPSYISNSVVQQKGKNEYSVHSSSETASSTIYNTSSTESVLSNKDEKKRASSSSPEIFEIFGISLHFDDILLICLLFFLYSEGVQDEWLFIALIMLLLS